MPCARSFFTVVSSTTPFKTAIPNSAMKPIAALIEKGMPRAHSSSTPPTAAKGTFR